MPTNGVKCLTCGEEIISQHRHDFVCCRCPAESETRVCVDGGPEYKRRLFGKEAKWEELDSGESGPEVVQGNFPGVRPASKEDEAKSVAQPPLAEGEPPPDASLGDQLDFAFEQAFKAGFQLGLETQDLGWGLNRNAESAWEEWSKQAGFKSKEGR